MHKLSRGILIVIEGIDGSGKSTLAKNVAAKLQEKKLPVVLTKEPGASQLGLMIRPLLQTQPFALNSKAEYLLFAADRAQHMQEIIEPALAKKEIVISDRMNDSSVVYQGFGRGLDTHMITAINAWTMNNKKADITFYLRISLEDAFKRLRSRKTLSAFEKEQTSFTKKLIEGFDTLYKTDPAVKLDATQSPETLTNKTVDYIEQWIHKNKLR